MKVRFNNYHQKDSRRGMTLIEMLVAVAILTMIILAFGTILTQAQKVVKTSQDNMRSNGTAAAIAQVIRQDIKQISKDGFLCITQKSTASSAPCLIFTTVGSTPSKTDPTVIGTGAITTMGYRTNSGSSEFGSNYPLLARQTWIPDPDTATSGDVWQKNMADILGLNRQGINELIGLTYTTNDSLLDIFFNTILRVPPETEYDISNLWQVLSYECNNVTIMWTDGDTDDATGDLKWYGVKDSGEDVSIKADGITEVTDLPDYDAEPDENKEKFLEENMEFKIGAIGGYRALWTNHDQSNWPKAIKISFAVHDPGTSEEMQAEDTGTTFKRYEVICPIGK